MRGWVNRMRILFGATGSPTYPGRQRKAWCVSHDDELPPPEPEANLTPNNEAEAKEWDGPCFGVPWVGIGGPPP